MLPIHRRKRVFADPAMDQSMREVGVSFRAHDLIARPAVGTHDLSRMVLSHGATPGTYRGRRKKSPLKRGSPFRAKLQTHARLRRRVDSLSVRRVWPPRPASSRYDGSGLATRPPLARRREMTASHLAHIAAGMCSVPDTWRVFAVSCDAAHTPP